MPYQYVAYDARNRVVHGSIDVPTERQASEALQRSGYTLLSLKQKGDSKSFRRQIPSLFGVKPKDVIGFSRMLATLLSRGTSSTVALQMIRDHAENVVFQEIIDEVLEDLRRGKSFAAALGNHPDAFPELYLRMIAVAERTGRLDEVLRRLADSMEKEQALASKVKGALFYPAFVMVVAGGVIMLLVMFTLPALADMFSESDAEIPWSTRLLVGFTNIVGEYTLALAGGGLAFAGAVYGALRLEAVRRKLDTVLLRLPIIGGIVLLQEMTNLARTISTGLSSSLAVPETLELAQKTSGNSVVGDAIGEVRGEILRGRLLSQSMARNPVFPRPLVQMTRVGEEAGTLDQDLSVIAETYESEVDKKVGAFVALLEPSLMVGMGVVVAFIVISVILPTYSIYGNIE